MDRPTQVVDSGGGAVFQGDITAGRDITINHFTEIRQATVQLHDRLGAIEDVESKLLERLDVLSWTAETVEEYAKDLQTKISSGDPQISTIARECDSILADIQRLTNSVEIKKDGSNLSLTLELLHEEIIEIRSRLMAVHFGLSHAVNRRMAGDIDEIRKTISGFMTDFKTSLRMDSIREELQNDDASSLRTFFSTSSIPFADRQMWRDLEKSFQTRFSSDFVRENFALIVTTIEDMVGEESNTSQSEDGGSNFPAERSNDEPEPDITSSNTRTRPGELWVNGSDNRWNERLLTIDGGGVKSYSSILIIRQLMNFVVEYENAMENAFTQYPRTFDIKYIRPCHYFDKVYGTSTGGILAILLARLRMTVPESVNYFHQVLHAMYSTPRNPIAFGFKYSHKPLEAALHDMIRSFCKQHVHGLCDGEDKFVWSSMDGHSADELCQTVCPTILKTQSMEGIWLVRTYRMNYNKLPANNMLSSLINPFDDDGTDDISIWEAARATSAMPLYFNPLLTYDTRYSNPVAVRDAESKAIQPSFVAFCESRALHGRQEPTVLLSIGSGNDNASDDGSLSFQKAYHPVLLGFFKPFPGKMRIFRKLYQYRTVTSHREMMRDITAETTHTWCKRFNAMTGQDWILPDKWEPGLWRDSEPNDQGKIIAGGATLTKLEIATEVYFQRDADQRYHEDAPPREMLRQTAEKLVRLRRARELQAMTEGGEKRERWEIAMGKYLPGEQDFFQKYVEQWDYAYLGRKDKG